jgi:polysaccharide biosynthesis/export protein
MQFPIRILALPAAIALLAGCAANELPLSMMGEPAAGAYHLRPGDTVLLEVFQEPYMTTRQPILEDGTIAVGLIGRIAIAGETVAGASDKIAARLDEKHLVNPQVVLTVEN